METEFIPPLNNNGLLYGCAISGPQDPAVETQYAMVCGLVYSIPI